MERTLLSNSAKFKDKDHEIQDVQREDTNREITNNRGEITGDEVKEALTKAKIGNAPGGDRIHAEMLKYGGPATINILTRIFQQAWNTKKIPDEWEKNILVPFIKKEKQLILRTIEHCGLGQLIAAIPSLVI